MSDTTPGSEPTPEPTPEPAPEPTSSSPTSSGQAVETLKGAPRLDLALIGAGLLVFLGSLLPYYTLSVDGFGASASSSVNAWHGFFGWFGALCALVAAALLVARILGVALPMPVPVRTAVLALFGLALLCTIVALVVTPGGDCDDMVFMEGVCDAIDQGHGIGYWLAFLGSIAGLALAVVRRTAD
ncbi:hypothetical protein [Nocardioides zhouii]|uniref:Uncharacterized protein n=1 Tax=Nocardioides zhouii TaxID=1168729 RepID=A0A4Q2SXX8_9ACTN|nr:hypothetical protein [Nocardioides zhouii]RYC11035.1 hypothetical protein EUA94_10455 [Nocardioides zhouii]